MRFNFYWGLIAFIFLLLDVMRRITPTSTLKLACATFEKEKAKNLVWNTMGIISQLILAKAIAEVDSMTTAERQRLIDEVRLEQPNLLISVLILDRWGVSHGQMATLLLLLLAFFTAVKKSGKVWPLITIEDWQQHLMRLVDRLDLVSRLVSTEARTAVQKAINTHLQPWLMAHAYGVMEDNGWFELQGRAHRHLVLTGLGLVECVAQGIVREANGRNCVEPVHAMQNPPVGGCDSRQAR